MASRLAELMYSRRSLVIGALLAAFVSRVNGAELKRWKGTPSAPAIDLMTTDGRPVSLQALRGKVVLVNFWATWCEPCIREMPSLQQLRDQLHADGFEVLAVNYQEGPARINSFIEKLQLSLPVVRDTDGSVARAWGARIFPANYLVDRAGNIRHSMSGAADWTSPSLVSTIRTLLTAQR
jgi:peroxiredoxin